MSYGSAYHNGADCEWCGVRVAWDQMKLHREWHMSLKIKMMKMAILDLAQIIYRDSPDMGGAVMEELQTRLGLSNSEGVSSE
jgi:hypothetical protein